MLLDDVVLEEEEVEAAPLPPAFLEDEQPFVVVSQVERPAMRPLPQPPGWLKALAGVAGAGLVGLLIYFAFLARIGVGDDDSPAQNPAEPSTSIGEAISTIADIAPGSPTSIPSGTSAVVSGTSVVAPQAAGDVPSTGTPGDRPATTDRALSTSSTAAQTAPDAPPSPTTPPRATSSAPSGPTTGQPPSSSVPQTSTPTPTTAKASAALPGYATGSTRSRQPFEPPWISPIPDLRLKVGQPVQYQIGVSTLPGETMRFEAHGLPDGLTLDSSTGVLQGTPTRAATFAVSLLVEGSSGYSQGAALIWTVAPA